MAQLANNVSSLLARCQPDAGLIWPFCLRQQASLREPPVAGARRATMIDERARSDMDFMQIALVAGAARLAAESLTLFADRGSSVRALSISWRASFWPTYLCCR